MMDYIIHIKRASIRA